MSDNQSKKVSGTTAAVGGVLALAGSLVGGGYSFATYEAEIRAAKEQAETALVKARAEKEEAIAACEQAAEQSIEEQQTRVNMLVERLEAIVQARASGQLEPQYKNMRQLPVAWTSRKPMKAQ